MGNLHLWAVQVEECKKLYCFKIHATKIIVYTSIFILSFPFRITMEPKELNCYLNEEWLSIYLNEEWYYLSHLEFQKYLLALLEEVLKLDRIYTQFNLYILCKILKMCRNRAEFSIHFRNSFNSGFSQDSTLHNITIVGVEVYMDSQILRRLN